MPSPVRRLTGLLPGFVLLCSLAGAAAHPLHTTITEVVHDARSRRVEAVVRVFADDLDRAVGGTGNGAINPRAVAAYLSRHFVLEGTDGRPIPLRYEGIRRTDDLLWIRLTGDATAGVRGGRIRNSIAHELYADQVNIVRVRYATTERTLLFTRGTHPQRLP